jgi:hypothetical protein
MRWLVLVLLFSGGDGRTPLMTAVLMGRTNDVKSLLAAGADVKARDKEQRLAIDYASPRQHPEIMELLRKAGSPPPTGHSGRLLCDAQARLTELGYEGGPADCVPRQMFWDALGAFQHIMDLAVTNQLDAPTLQALGLE